MGYFLRSCIVTVGFFSMTAFGDFLPQNDLYLEDNINFTGGITENDFNSVMDQIDEVYGPIVESLGGKLVFKRNWKDSTVNASANQTGGTWYVSMYGGLARRAEVTADGFTMVVCHELGHHIGGFPLSGWAANEGQSDYFAALSCARLLWGKDKETNAQYRDQIGAIPQEKCDSLYRGKDRQNLCYRQMLAGESIAGLLAALRGDVISYETPDTSVVKRTQGSHPASQCRFDTYISANLCDVEWNHEIIPQTETESSPYTCTIKGGYEIGTRPKCWFKERS